MPTLLLNHIQAIATMDDQRREIADGAILIQDNVIIAVDTAATVGQYIDQQGIAIDETIDLQQHVVMPGLVNTHHHMFQSLTRAIPAAQNCELFDWLETLYPIWSHLTAQMIYDSTRTAMAELLLSGCTTSSDHLYLFPNDCQLDDSLRAAAEMGMRFHACRGSMSVGRSAGGLPPDDLVEREDDILADCVRLIETWHDPERFAMIRIALAPCSPFSVSPELMRKTAELARQSGVRLHTHLAENDKDVSYSRQQFGLTPAEYAESLGWVGPDVWHAHCVKLDDAGIALFARTQTGVAHCPCSNMRLASGITPVAVMMAAHVPVGLGVDGSASNDGAHLLGEARQAMLLARVNAAPDTLTAREALFLATRGGASVLGRDDIGALAVGMAADIIAFRTDILSMAGGALHDPIAATLFCTPQTVDLSIINGKIVVQDGQLMTQDLGDILQQHQRSAQQLLAASGQASMST